MSTIYPLNGSIKQIAQEANVLAAEGDRAMPSMTGRNLQIITGFKAACIRKLIWANLYFLALRHQGSHKKALASLRQLNQLRLRFRRDDGSPKYVTNGRRYFVNLNTPGWPSPAFNRYVSQQFRKLEGSPAPTLTALILAITKKCGFRCEHCFEWDNLNLPERLHRNDITEIIHRFTILGVAQLQLSGGEPMNRYADLPMLIGQARKHMDCWLYTTGYSLTKEKATRLKAAGLTGVIISLDDYRMEYHDRFRGVPGAWTKAMNAIQLSRKAGLLVALSCCTTGAFVSLDNLDRYVALARNCGVSFIQFLEPRAVGHYSGKDVELTPTQIGLMERFYEGLSQSPSRAANPVISYHGYHARKSACSGNAKDYVYVDTDGDVHSCPFCQKKQFSALADGFAENMQRLRQRTCGIPAFTDHETILS